MFLVEEARVCRSLAAAFEGRAEASFLLKAAQAFDDLATRGAPWQAAGATVDHCEPSRHLIRLF